MSSQVNGYVVGKEEIAAHIRENFDREVTDCPTPMDVCFRFNEYISLEQFEYYLWWRTSVRHGEYPEVSNGLFSMFFYELLVIGKPFDEIDRWAVLLAKEYEGNESSPVATYVSLSANLIRGRFPDSTHPDTRRFRTQFILAGPSVTVDDDFVTRITNVSAPLPSGSSELISRTFEIMAGRLWDERDIGIVEYLSNQRAELLIKPFGDIFPVDYKMIYDEPWMTDHAFKKLSNIMRYCLWTLDRKFVRNPGRLDDLVKSSVATALSDMKSGKPRPTEWLPLRTLSIFPFEERVLRLRYQTKCSAIHNMYSIVRTVPVCKTVSYGKKDWRSKIKKFIGDGRHVESRYVPSPNTLPLPSELNDAQRNYYLHWRSEMCRNRYLDTDLGYIALRCLELVEGDGDVNERAEKLFSLACGYPCKMTFDTCIGFSLVNGLHYPPLVFDDETVNQRLFDSLKMKPITPMSASDLLSIVNNIVSDSYIDVDPYGFAVVTNYLLNRFDDTLYKNEGKRLIDLLNAEPGVETRVRVYGYLKRYGISKTVGVDYHSPISNHDFYKFIIVSVLSAARYICSKNGSTMPQMPPYSEELIADAEVYIEELRPYEVLRFFTPMTRQRHLTDPDLSGYTGGSNCDC